MATFGERLKELRKERQLTIEELAKELGSAKSTISRYENNLRDPKKDFLEILSRYFNVSIDYLLGNTEVKSPNAYNDLPNKLTNPQEAIKFLLEQPSFMQYGDYDIKKLSDEELLDFANEILNYLKYVSQKYSNK